MMSHVALPVSNRDRNFPIEIMDGSDFTDSEYFETLSQLGTINRWTGGHQLIVDEVHRYLRERSSSTETDEVAATTLLDFGSGGGDTIIELARSLQNTPWQKKVRLCGVDLNPKAIEFSRRALERSGLADSVAVDFFCGDIFDPDFLSDLKVDLVLTSMTLHHFTNPDLVQVLKELWRRSSDGLLINDLHRAIVPREFIRVVTALLGASRLIRHDAPASVQRGFKRNDWLILLRSAGLEDQVDISLSWRWAYRWCVRLRAKNGH